MQREPSETEYQTVMPHILVASKTSLVLRISLEARLPVECIADEKTLNGEALANAFDPADRRSRAAMQLSIAGKA